VIFIVSLNTTGRNITLALTLKASVELSHWMLDTSMQSVVSGGIVSTVVFVDVMYEDKLKESLNDEAIG
jgi:hypothetical protein